MAELQFSNIVGQYQQGYDRGQAQRANKLAGLAYSSQGDDRQSALGQLAGVDPRLAVGLGDAFQKQDAAQAQAQKVAEVDHQKKLAGAAKFALDALDSKDPARIQGAGNLIGPYLTELSGKPFPGLDESQRPMIYQILGQNGGEVPGPDYMNVGNGVVFDKTSGKVAYQAPQRDTGELATLRAMQQDPSLIDTYRRAHPQASGGENGKASDWVVQQGKDGQLYRVNKLNGAAIPVVSQGTQQDGTPVIGANSFRATAQDQKVGKARAAVNAADADLDRLAQAAQNVLDSHGLGGITGVSGKFPNIPGSDASNAQALLDTLKSQVGFSVLQNMRANSPTGGALGAVSDRENEMLQSNLAALGQAQSEQQYRQQLQNIIDYAKQSKQRRHAALEETYGSDQSGPQSAPVGASSRPRATNPQTGQTIEFDGQNWVPVNG